MRTLPEQFLGEETKHFFSPQWPLLLAGKWYAVCCWWAVVGGLGLGVCCQWSVVSPQWSVVSGQLPPSSILPFP